MRSGICIFVGNLTAPSLPPKTSVLLFQAVAEPALKLNTHQSLFPCPITKRMFLGGIDCNTGFRTHQKTLVLTWKNCINIVGNQRTVISTILMDKLFLINVINKESGSTGTDIQDTVFSLV